MNSSPISVSLCVIRVEIIDEDSEESNGAMATKMRGCREPSKINMENCTNLTENQDSAVPSQGTSKSSSASRANSEENTYDDSEIAGASACACDQINFISGNPFVEVTKGIIHLYKENKLTDIHHAAERTQTICILSVPATMTCHDLLRFTAPCHQDVRHFRILRDGSPNQYMALITFKSANAATEFYGSFNGTPYNSFEPDVICHMVFVYSVEVTYNAMPLSGHTELPLCPVCLERMDESVDGILTILCNHTFHASCLAKWGDTSCPVCRYAQTPESFADSYCMECNTGESNDALWICLICGHIGCSRYHQGHAFQHYRETHHCYAMQLGNNRVWDYVGDNFVHRLLQNKDGKMVEGGPTATKAEGAAMEEKVDSVQLEFTYLLTSQLETQRQYFEDRLARLEQHSVLQTTELREKVGQVSEENAKTKEQLATLTREKQNVDKRLQQVSNKLVQVQAELTEEKELRKALELNQASWQDKYKMLQDEMTEYQKTKQTEITNLKEQVQDLMFYLDAQNKVENSELREEIASGRIVIPETSNSAKKNIRPSKSRKKR
ncbi:BRCA1-associated protein isoform X1 [Bombus vosnesenskii]|uniref:BRCA1-associated protein isoform X1 n=4 Tax=Pyrobombus TaxID=144703 RepID=A0A6J3KNK4_9HYME|nr:BRCA1-associated protein isoform X1 [Bombus impatiens]XP_033353459.1 BRCA1-associated protein isoform X1 [Bombus vosnesenskii]XP_050482599.1 BRCA1-associated protein isoform X1 [Bombus huntii]